MSCKKTPTLSIKRWSSATFNVKVTQNDLPFSLVWKDLFFTAREQGTMFDPDNSTATFRIQFIPISAPLGTALLTFTETDTDVRPTTYKWAITYIDTTLPIWEQKTENVRDLDIVIINNVDK